MTISKTIRGIRDRITGGDSAGKGIKILGRQSQGDGPVEVLDLTQVLQRAGAIGGAPVTVPVGANPTATASDTAVNGSAATFMRSDGAPAVQKGSSSQFGIIKVDGTTITESSGVISAPGSGQFAGYDFFAMHPLSYAAAGISVALALAANGGSLLTPIFVKAQFKLQSLTYRNTDTTNPRSMEWRLYKDDNSGVSAAEIAGANGSESFTASAASTREVAVGSPPIVLLPGIYWAVVRNTHATNTLGIGTGAATNGLVPTYGKTKTLGSALSTPLDIDTGWVNSSIGNAIAAVRLNGRILGQSTSWS